MKGLFTVVFATQLLVVAAFAQTTTPPGSSIGSASSTVIALDPAPQNPVVRILTPVEDEKFIRTNSVKVRFDLVGPATSAKAPNFLVQMDGDEPVRTGDMEQSFSGLEPGVHSVAVQLVSANNTPDFASRAVVQFVVAPHPPETPHPVTAHAEALNVAPEEALNVTLQQETPEPPQLTQLGVLQSPPAEIMSINSPLPSAGNALPLISVIGFGVLVGGIASAMRTR